MIIANGFLKNLLSGIGKDKEIYLTSLFVIVMSISVLWIYSPEKLSRISLYSQILSPVSAAILMLHFTFYYLKMIYIKEGKPTSKLFKLLYSYITKPEKLVLIILMMININFVLSCFTLLKLTIPKIVPFSFDVLFSDIDKLFHFNYQPWELTHGLFQSPYFSLTINILYNLWFFVLIYVLFYFIVTNTQNRKRYLLSFILSWFIIGNLFATLFSSVGPCFLFKLDPTETDFLPLMETLAAQSHLLTNQNWPELWAIGTQNTLWEKYVADDVMIGAGISAMPSMHVASTTLMALAVKRENRWFGNLFIAYAIIIQIGSVHLAWHYAIDGYLAAIMAWIIWHYVNRYYDNKQIVTPG